MELNRNTRILAEDPSGPVHHGIDILRRDLDTVCLPTARPGGADPAGTGGPAAGKLAADHRRGYPDGDRRG